MSHSPRLLMDHLSEAIRDGESTSVLNDLWEVVADSIELSESNYKINIINDGHVLLLLLVRLSDNNIEYSFEVSIDTLKLWSKHISPKLIRSDNNQAHMHLHEDNGKFIITIGTTNPLSIYPLCRFLLSEDNVNVLKRLALTINKIYK